MLDQPISQTKIQDTLISSLCNKPVINSAMNMDNTVPRNEIPHVLLSTIDHLIDILLRHCGPEASYCMLTSGTGMGTFEPNLFLKDGIKIVNSIEYTSPIQNYVKNLIAYIGQRVDSAAKDGTTSSMLIACYVLKYLIEHKNELAQIGYDTTIWMEAFNEFSTMLLHILTEKYGVFISMSNTIPNTEEVRTISYNQAMSSSNGITELAEAVAELFTAMPPELWQYVVTSQSTIEKSKMFEVVYDTYQYRMSVNIQTSNIYNKYMNTMYEGKNVYVLPLADGLVDGSVLLDKVFQYLTTVPSDTSCIVLCTNVSSQFIRTVEQMNLERQQPIIVGSVIPSIHSYSENNEWYLLALSAIAGTYNYADYKEYTSYPVPVLDRHVIRVPLVEFDGIDMYFYSIYKEKKNSNFHPYYLHPKKFPPYTELLRNFRTIIDRERTRHNPREGRIMTLQLIIYQMVCNHTCKLVIGGDTHDNVSAVSVVQDVVGATISSLHNGVLVGGILHFYRALLDLDTVLAEDTSLPITKKRFMNLFLHSLKYATLEVIHETYSTNRVAEVELDRYQYINAKPVIEDIRALLKEYADKAPNSPSPKPLFHMDCNIFSVLVTLEKSYRAKGDMNEVKDVYDYVCNLGDSSESYAPMQPITVYKELLRRIKELILKVFLTETIVVPNSVYIPQNWLEEQKEEE